MENRSIIALFSPKISQKATRDPSGPARIMKTIFFEWPGYENPMLEERILELSPIEKELV